MSNKVLKFNQMNLAKGYLKGADEEHMKTNEHFQGQCFLELNIKNASKRLNTDILNKFNYFIGSG